MTKTQYEDNKLAFVDVVHDSVVADSGAEFSVTTDELLAPRWSRITLEQRDLFQDAFRSVLVELLQSLRGRARVRDVVLHSVRATAQIPSSATRSS